MFSIQIITLSIVAVLNAILVWLIITQGWRSIANRFFMTAAFFSVFWIAGAVLFFGAPDEALARTGLLFFYVAPMFVVVSLCFFATMFHSHTKPWTLQNIIFVTMTIIIASLTIWNQDILTASVTLAIEGNNQFQVNTLGYFIYSLYFTFGFSIVLIEFIINILHNKGFRKKQLMYIASAMAVVIVLSSITNISMPVFGITEFIWIGPFCTFIAIILITISIIKHALFDIKLAAVRSVAYIGVLVTMSIIYYLIAYILSVVVIGTQVTDAVSISPINILLALVLAFLFQPIKRFFDKVTNDIFYQDNYSSEEFFANLSNLLISTTDLRGLLERSSNEIASTFKSEQAFYYLYYTNAIAHHMSAGTQHHSRLPVHDADMLDTYVAKNDEKIFLTDYMEESPVRRMLLSHKIGLVMPLRNSERIMGYVLLGEHRSGNYTKRDLNVLIAISSELVIAIQNALSLHEVKELNATLQQRIDVATKELRSSNAQLKHLDEVKDEFMSMASHQLRTPLTSVKGYISMVLEGDAGSVTPHQKKLLSEAFGSSERMVGLIGDFLNVSRLQTGKFVIDKAPLDIKALVKQEISVLKMIAGTHDMKLKLTITDKPLPIEADKSKLQQVVMNFVDNAIYYSPAGSTIAINLDRVGSDMALTVVDTGIGVPEDEQSKLFGKFFRAKNARKQRPDGTGVGLYLARRVISAHGGGIIFSSREGKGSTFGFRLPLSESEPTKK